MLTQCGNDHFRVFAGHLDQHGKARMALHQSRNIGVLGTGQQIPFPVAGNRSVFYLPGLSRMETASTICPRDCPLALAWRERRMRRFERSWSSSSFFSTPRA